MLSNSGWNNHLSTLNLSLSFFPDGLSSFQTVQITKINLSKDQPFCGTNMEKATTKFCLSNSNGSDWFRNLIFAAYGAINVKSSYT